MVQNQPLFLKYVDLIGNTNIWIVLNKEIEIQGEPVMSST